MTDTLFDKLSMPATPDRPFEDDGTVLQASDTPLLPMQVWSRCEDLVAAHLAQVCAWPAAGQTNRNRISPASLFFDLLVMSMSNLLL